MSPTPANLAELLSRYLELRKNCPNLTDLSRWMMGESSRWQILLISVYRKSHNIILESIVIPASVKYIAYRAFKGCSKLKNVKILNKDIILGLEVFDK